MNNRDPYGLCADDSPVNERGFFGNLWTGALYGDYAQDTGWGGMVGEVGVGFIPIAGQIAGVRDTTANIPKVWNAPGDYRNWASLSGAVISVFPAGKAIAKGGKAGFKALTRGTAKGAQKLAQKQVDDVAKALKMTPIERKEFGKYIEKTKDMSGRGGADNYTYQQLIEIGKEFKGL